MLQRLIGTLTQGSPGLLAALTRESSQQRIVGALIVAFFMLAGLVWILNFHRAKTKIPAAIRGDEDRVKAPPAPPPGSPEDLTRTLKMYEQVLALARREDDRTGEAEARSAIGSTYFLADDLAPALTNHAQALALYREAGDGHGVTRELRHIGQLHLSRGEAAQAREVFDQALAAARARRDAGDINQALADLAAAHFALGDEEQGRACQRQVSSEDPPPSRRRAEAVHLWRCATVLRKLGRRREAIAHGEEGLKIFERIKDPQVEGVRRTLGVWRSERQGKAV